MSDIKLFQLTGPGLTELTSAASKLEKTLKNYFAFKRIKNFACVEIKTQLKAVRLFLKIDPTSIELEPGFSRDVRNVGHFGTGELEVTVKTPEEFDKAKPLILQSYEAS